MKFDNNEIEVGNETNDIEIEVGTEDIEGMEITEIRLFSDFSEPGSLEAEIFYNLIEDIIKEETIQKEVEASVKDLIDSVEENVKSLEKKTFYRKCPISKANWKMTQHRKAHESGQEFTNHKGKLIAAKTIKVKKDCMNSCKFNCAQHIEKESQEMIFTEFYKLDTNGKHSFIAQTSVCSSVSGNKESRKKIKLQLFSHERGKIF